MSEMAAWRDGEFAPGIINDLALSCVNSMTGSAAMGQVLVDDISRVLGIAAAAEDGNATIAEASTSLIDAETLCG
ncbi:MAG TPA: hypothetical protein VJA46_12175 [Acidimicrobiia bacterium]|nr:hypothetical protein [Acidimicrobiia bacterium]